jgi:hypothetical protein
MTRRRAILCALVALAVATAGCDDDDDDAEPTTTPVPRQKETFQKVPELPPGWKVHANRDGGFAFGLPPGWNADDDTTTTRVRSFDRLVAVSITPDRTVDGLAIPLENFALRTIAALTGFEGELDPGPARRFKHKYRGSEVRAAGRAETGVREQVRVFVLRRDEIVTFTAVMAVNAKPSAHASERLAERMLHTLRSRPVGAARPKDRGKRDSGSDGDRPDGQRDRPNDQADRDKGRR